MKVPPVKLFSAVPELAAKFAPWGGFGDELRPQGCCGSSWDQSEGEQPSAKDLWMFNLPFYPNGLVIPA